MAPYTASAWDGLLRVTGTIEGHELHLVRTYGGQQQHKYLRADVHAQTADELRIAVHTDLDYLRHALLVRS